MRLLAAGSAGALASAGAALSLVAGPAGASAQTFTVDSLTDDGTGGLTLREAIEAANANPGADTVDFSVTGSITLSSSLPRITDNLTITGPGVHPGQPSVHIDARYHSVFTFTGLDAADGALAVSGLEIEFATAIDNPGLVGGAIAKYDGDAPLTIANVRIGSSNARLGGAVGLYRTTGDLTIVDSSFSRGYGGDGGGSIWIRSTADDDVTITGSTFSDNVTRLDGGALYLDFYGAAAATVNVIDSTFAGNGAVVAGGAARFRGAEVRIDRSTFTGNYAVDGSAGAIQADHVDLMITSSTLSGNYTVVGDGGAIRTNVLSTLTVENSTLSDNWAGSDGGALYVGDTAAINNSTISGNTADRGGAVFQYGPGLVVVQSTITDNHAAVDPTEHPVAEGGILAVGTDLLCDTDLATGCSAGVDAAVTPTVSLHGSIVAGNDGDDLAGVLALTLVESEQSVLGAVEAAVSLVDLGGTQVDATDPGLAPLADNGGPTKTHAIRAGSPALDAGLTTGTMPDFDGNAFDQRGAPYVRVSGVRADCGAYEVQVAPTPEPTPEPTFTG